MLIETIETIAKEICEYPDEVSVKEINTSNNSIIEVRVHKDDLGKMIGKRGKTADAIRTIIYSCSFKYNKRFTLDMVAK